MSNKKCDACKGRGRWSERTEDEDGSVHIESKYCFTCNGTGISQDVEDGQDWDIGGDSYADED